MSERFGFLEAVVRILWVVLLQRFKLLSSKPSFKFVRPKRDLGFI